jgi:type VI secretion system protein ImpA
VDDLTQCRDELGALSQALEERCGRSAAPPVSSIRAALEGCLDAIRTIARDKLAVSTESGGAARDGEGSPASGAAGVPVVAGAIRDREDALQTLLKVADFFRRTEPHTPVSYALEQAVRWGRMTLPELLAELVPDEQPRASLFKQIGIRPPGS